MLKVVLDTNILVSSIFWSGASYKILKLITRSKIESYTSISILNELKQVLKSKIKYNLPEAKVQEIVELTKLHSFLVYPKRQTSIAKDPKDNKFIECAIETKADYIISGDKHLLDLKKHKNIWIVTPSKFLEIFRKYKAKKTQK